MRVSDDQWRMVSNIAIQSHPPEALLPTNTSTDQQTKAQLPLSNNHLQTMDGYKFLLTIAHLHSFSLQYPPSFPTDEKVREYSESVHTRLRVPQDI